MAFRIILDVILLAVAAACLIGGAASAIRRKPFITRIAAAALLAVIGGPLLARHLQQPAAAVPGNGLITKAESAASAAYTGPVTPATFFRFMHWTGPLTLTPADGYTIAPAGPGALVALRPAGKYLVLGLPADAAAAIGAGNTTGNGNLPYPGYEFSVTSAAGQTAVVDFPSTMLNFSVIPAGRRPSAQFVFRTTVFYVKSADQTSIFTAGEDRNARRAGSYREDAGREFGSTPAGQLLRQWAVTVDIGVTPGQFAALTNPKLAGIPAA